MSYPWRETPIRSRLDLLRALRLTLWVGPGLMALIGIGYMPFEHQRQANDPDRPWPTVLEILEKLGVSNRVQAIAEALRRGWI
jgi:hypothetical protein